VKSHVSKKRKERNEVDRPSRQAGGRDGISQCQTYPASEHKAAQPAAEWRTNDFAIRCTMWILAANESKLWAILNEHIIMRR